MPLKRCLLLFTIFLLPAISCSKPLAHHSVHGDIRLKDSVYLSITADFYVESEEALRELKANTAQLRFAMTLALRDHTSTELSGRGKRAVHNAMKSIVRQLIDHKVKEIHITSYDFHDKPFEKDMHASSHP